MMIFNRCDFTVDDLQIINAATHGASAITLSGEMTDDLKAQIDTCKKYNVEPLIMKRFLPSSAVFIIDRKSVV